MIIMYIGCLIVRRVSARRSADGVLDPSFAGLRGFTDLVNIHTVDLKKHEHEEEADEQEDEAVRAKRLGQGKFKALWRIYYSIA